MHCRYRMSHETKNSISVVQSWYQKRFLTKMVGVQFLRAVFAIFSVIHIIKSFLYRMNPTYQALLRNLHTWEREKENKKKYASISNRSFFRSIIMITYTLIKSFSNMVFHLKRSNTHLGQWTIRHQRYLGMVGIIRVSPSF